LLGNGDGTFRPPVTTLPAPNLGSLAVADFQGYGQRDLLALGSDAGTGNSVLYALLGNGDGTFRIGHQYQLPALPSNLAVGDFNGDGNLDVAVSFRDVSSIEVFLGHGDGSFGPPSSYDGSGSITVADLSGNNRPDLVVTHGALGVLLNNGDGNFQAERPIVTGLFTSAAVGDFNGDGKADLAAGNPVGYQVTVLLGNGDGSLQTAPSYGVLSNINGSGVALADLTGNGILDLVEAVPLGDSGDVDVGLGHGDGTFGASTTYTVSAASSLVVADVNGDGIPDIVTTGPGHFSQGHVVSVLLGNGDGTFAPPVT
jgi:hypothetical protein